MQPIPGERMPVGMVKPAVIIAAFDKYVGITQILQGIQASVLTVEGEGCCQIPAGCLDPKVALFFIRDPAPQLFHQNIKQTLRDNCFPDTYLTGKVVVEFNLHFRKISF